MALATPRIPAGMMELLPARQVLLQKLLDTIRRAYERFGFLPVETPVMEYVDVLLTKSGGDTEKQVYFVQSTGNLKQGKPPDLALRFDLTVPLARYVAQHEHDLSFPFRRYQMQRVYRGESAQRGRFREFYQCDIDVIGKDTLGLAHDAEIPAVIAGLFEELDFGAFTIGINNRKILGGLLDGLGLAAGDPQRDVMREIDKLDKRGRSAVEETLQAPPFELAAAKVASLMDFIAIRGANSEVLRALERMDVPGGRFKQGVEELRFVLDGIATHGVDPRRHAIKLDIARGLDYYTGTVYETQIDAHPEIGSVCSGGRYDDLASHYTKSRLPGVGISIGATRLFDQITALGLWGQGKAAMVDILVARLDPRFDAETSRLAADLRRVGLRVQSILEAWKPKKQFQYADALGARFVVMYGEDEHARSSAAVKDMATGQQIDVPVADIARIMRERFSGAGGP